MLPMKQFDPFNWEFPKKQETMSLQSVTQLDVGLRKFHAENARTRNLNTKDIEGAIPILPGYKYSNKTHYQNKTGDIDGASPKKLMRPLDKQYYNLTNKDIEGSVPQIVKFQSIREPHNPLTPVYNLPQSEVRIADPPKFIRDAIEISDIQGTKPAEKYLRTRTAGYLGEIQGSKPKVRYIPKDGIDSLNVYDINHYLKFETTRNTNPLEPIYITSNKEGEKFEYGQIEKSKNSRRHPEQINKPVFNLATRDIDGAWVGTLNERFLRQNNGRKNFRDINNITDIRETQVGSLRKGIQTVRQTCPLQPKYQSLGNENDMYYTGEHMGYPQTADPRVERCKVRANSQQIDNTQQIDNKTNTLQNQDPNMKQSHSNNNSNTWVNSTQKPPTPLAIEKPGTQSFQKRGSQTSSNKPPTPSQINKPPSNNYINKPPTPRNSGSQAGSRPQSQAQLSEQNLPDVNGTGRKSTLQKFDGFINK